MEELGRTSRLARRLALATMFCCTTSAGYAADPPASESTQVPTFRSLLAEGWSGSKFVGPASSPVAKSQIATSHEPKLPAATKPTAAESDGNVTIVRPRLRVIQVPASVLTRIDEPEQIVQSIKAVDVKPEVAARQKDTAQSKDSAATKQEKAAAASAPTSLAELIQRHTKPLQVPVLTQDPDAFQVEFAPSVRRLGVEQQIAANAMRQREESAANVQVAKPINAQPQLPQSKVAQSKVAQSTIAQSKVAQPKVAQPKVAEPEVAQPTIAQRKITEPQITEAPDGETEQIPSAIAKVVPEQVKSEQLSSDAPATSVIAKSAPVEAPIREAQKPISSVPEALINLPMPSIEGEVVATLPSDRSRQVAIDNGFGLLPLESFGSDTAVELGSERDEGSMTVTIHATRLRELARESLQNASHRMQRQATHSAKKYALEALRSIVAMRDAEAGGNQHSKQLDMALDAIRESDDFCGRFGVVDQIALQRMVAVHETDVLKGRDLENVSSLEATDTYLAVAKQNLVAAAGGVREASDALVLLGQIEKQISKPGDTHAAAVAVTLQRAAIEVAPTNGPGYRELGTTLLDQGLVEPAARALSRSIELQPTRSGYQGLLEASRRLGDVETARLCLAALRNPSILSETPVKTLSPEVFAATYKPNLNELKSATLKPQSPAADAPKVEPTRISLRTLFPFNRR